MTDRWTIRFAHQLACTGLIWTMTLAGPANPATIMDSHRAGPVVTFAGSETSSPALAGSVVKNSQASRGGGILGTGVGACEYTSPSLLALPDLVAATGSVIPQQARPGELVQVSFQVRNDGDSAAGANWAHVRLSTDRFYSTDDFLWIQSILVPPLNPTQTFNYSAPVPVPRLAPVSHYALVECDALHEVAESIEQNNVLVIGTLEQLTRAIRWPLYR